MSLEDYSPDIDSSESWWNSSEASREVSEKFKESIKKASAWVGRTKRDESKAKAYDMLLANFLVKLILDKKYDNLLSLLFSSLDKWYPSNFLIWIMSLVYIDISHKIRELSLKPQIEYSYKAPNPVEFDDDHLHPQVKQRINEWVEDMIDSVSVEYSSLLTNRLVELLKTDEDIIVFISKVFSFFLKESNIVISESQSQNIVSFILKEVYASLNRLNVEEI